MPISHLVRSAAVSLGLVFIAACSSPFGPSWKRVIGTIEVGGQHSPSPIHLPSEIRSGVSFSATVVTYGSSTCTRADGADVQVTGLTAEITPYDLRRTGKAVCTDDLAPHPREVRLRFNTPGEALIRVRGRSIAVDEPAVYDTTVTVLP